MALRTLLPVLLDFGHGTYKGYIRSITYKGCLGLGIHYIDMYICIVYLVLLRGLFYFAHSAFVRIEFSQREFILVLYLYVLVAIGKVYILNIHCHLIVFRGCILVLCILYSFSWVFQA